MILGLIGFTRLVEMRKFVVFKPRYNSLGATIILLPLDITKLLFNDFFIYNHCYKI